MSGMLLKPLGNFDGSHITYSLELGPNSDSGGSGVELKRIAHCCAYISCVCKSFDTFEKKNIQV